MFPFSSLHMQSLVATNQNVASSSYVTLLLWVFAVRDFKLKNKAFSRMPRILIVFPPGDLSRPILVCQLEPVYTLNLGLLI